MKGACMARLSAWQSSAWQYRGGPPAAVAVGRFCLTARGCHAPVHGSASSVHCSKLSRPERLPQRLRRPHGSSRRPPRPSRVSVPPQTSGHSSWLPSLAIDTTLNAKPPLLPPSSHSVLVLCRPPYTARAPRRPPSRNLSSSLLGAASLHRVGWQRIGRGPLSPRRSSLQRKYI
jgi:hypothetical protein